MAEQSDRYAGIVFGRVEELLPASHITAGPVQAVFWSPQRGGVVFAR